MNSDVKVVDVVVDSVFTTSVAAVILTCSVISELGRSVIVVANTFPAAMSTSILMVPIPGNWTSRM